MFPSPSSSFTPDNFENMMSIVKTECDSTEMRPLAFDPLPSVEDYEGIYDFNIKVSQPTQVRTSCFYSSILQQVFIDINKTMLVHFSVSRGICGLFVRALPVYAAPEFSALPVTRCTVHAVDSDPRGIAHAGGVCNCTHFSNVGHVIQSVAPDAQYCYDPTSRRHSVIVPVKPLQPGSNGFAIPYTFTCKTSCRMGMQRRPINVVFTLETAFGDVLGRKILGVRICTCPKRDKERSERDVIKVPRPSICQSIPKRRRGRPGNADSSKTRISNLIKTLASEICDLERFIQSLGGRMSQLVNFSENI